MDTTPRLPRVAPQADNAGHQGQRVQVDAVAGGVYQPAVVKEHDNLHHGGDYQGRPVGTECSAGNHIDEQCDHPGTCLSA
jgi:hypothetical protein